MSTGPSLFSEPSPAVARHPLPLRGRGILHHNENCCSMTAYVLMRIIFRDINSLSVPTV